MQANRKSMNENDNMILFSEVEGMCPFCSKSLLYVKDGIRRKIFEAAHIYPLNPTKEESLLLKNVEKLSQNVNDLNNSIALCRDCHKKFDSPRTIEEYKKLLIIKKEIIRRNERRADYHSYQIEAEIKIILNKLVENENELSPQILNLDALKVDEKANITLNRLTKRRIKSDVADYYFFVKEQFIMLDKECQYSFDTIASQVNTFYLKLKKNKHTQEEIYNHMAEWLSKKTENSSLEACKIIVSFFIQNCEVFS
ncbi:ABC-three component system protein [Paenibacillus sp. S29]|uniref:ABC-three component system protein n=2 Tax=Paenibacillus TaxID=44249 RepID=UPI0039BF56AE